MKGKILNLMGKGAPKQSNKYLPVIINETAQALIRGVDMAAMAGDKKEFGVTLKLVASAWSGSNLANSKDVSQADYGKAARNLLKAIECLPEVKQFIDANAEAHRRAAYMAAKQNPENNINGK